ncbi:hypothetical protein PGT21_003547 [Puccinia graminis f. sp. tritici]|uniref:Uncharacterized protein n=1 Tax=Puccinia graminis f. sp. tritici TaxID=56615 RepID=A0A5B0PQZ3_PUCGR|nr:hypothetical protein PGT21_003547 [Puccinia graminis f. sp. tritici]
MSITGVSNIMTNVLKNFGNNAIPPAVIHEATKLSIHLSPPSSQEKKLSTIP